MKYDMKAYNTSSGAVKFAYVDPVTGESTFTWTGTEEDVKRKSKSFKTFMAHASHGINNIDRECVWCLCNECGCAGIHLGGCSHSDWTEVSDTDADWD